MKTAFYNAFVHRVADRLFEENDTTPDAVDLTEAAAHGFDVETFENDVIAAVEEQNREHPADHPSFI